MKSIAALALIALAPAVFADNPAISIDIDAAANRHAIDPRIYGSSWASAAQITELGLTLNRWGGNAMSRYNWIYSTANRCKDYYFFNIPDWEVTGDGSNGDSADVFIDRTFDAGAEPVMTIPMLSLLPKDRTKRCSFPQSLYPTQQEFSTGEPIVCGNGRNPDGSRLITAPDPNDISTSYPMSHQGDWVQHLIDTWGTAPTILRHYSLDNEPSLWSADHWDVHPDGSSYDEVWGKMEELGAIIRAKDPNAIITGPEEWGWSGYFWSGLDQENWGTAQHEDDREAHGNAYYIDWLLDQAQAYHTANGVRILDVLTVHYYPQEGEFWSGDTSEAMQNLRNRSTRSLWDPSYVDTSWINDTVRLIPRLKEWVANHYPGTRIGITEYNWGVDTHINGGTTQADILGIFGREGIDLGVRWGTPAIGSYAANAFKMYRNYDGAGSKFGDTSVSASAPDPDNVSAFASERSTDAALTIMLIAKTLTGNTPVTVNLTNFTAGGTIQRWELTSTNVITQLAGLTPSNSIVLTLPAQSITLLVVPAVPTLTATATSTSSVALTWTAVAGAASYSVERSVDGGAFAVLVTVGTTSHDEMELTANTSYLYRVRADVTGAGFSNVDAATTIAFTDPTLTSGTIVKAVHFTELRTAVNAMRAAAGLTAHAFTDPLTIIEAVHMTELRSALDAARAAIGLPALAYSDDPLVAQSTTVKAAQVNEVREGVR